jgi:hypothetical protein
MVGTDGKQYPVPANYASKSKLVEGDVLKLSITPDGSFIYKQIGPAQRKNVIGIVSQDEKGNYFVFSEGRPYKVLLASITYFKADPGDEVVIVVPREIESTWAAIENVIKKGGEILEPAVALAKKKLPADGGLGSWKSNLSEDENDEKNQSTQLPKEKAIKKSDENSQTIEDANKDVIIDEWKSDIEALEKEISSQA